jgi:hypothetical protein
MAKRLTIIELKGDTDAILAQKRENDSVIESAASENGGIFHVAARSDDGLILVNLWDSAEGSDAVAEKPEVQQAIERMGSVVQGPPTRTHYEVEDYKTPNRS